MGRVITWPRSRGLWSTQKSLSIRTMNFKSPTFSDSSLYRQNIQGSSVSGNQFQIRTPAIALHYKWQIYCSGLVWCLWVLFHQAHLSLAAWVHLAVRGEGVSESKDPHNLCVHGEGRTERWQTLWHRCASLWQMTPKSPNWFPLT